MKLKKLIESIIREDQTDDKLADLTKSFNAKDITGYVGDLQKYLSDPKVAAVIKAGVTDGNPDDEKLQVNPGNINANKLYPTQNEIGAEESLKDILTDQYGSLEGFLNGTAEFPTPVITYNSEWVLDGHHRWSQAYVANPDVKIPVLDITGKLSPEQILMAVHTAIAAKSGQTDTREANLKAGNLLAYSPEDVKTYVANELTSKARDVYSKFGLTDDNLIADYIASNVEQMRQNNGPKTWAPSRSFMPQPGNNNADDFDKYLEKGVANFNDPKQSDIQESVIRRWSRIANIKK